MSDLIAQADNMETAQLIELYAKKKEMHDLDPTNDIRCQCLKAIKHVLKERGVEVE